jgi:hypothetical protein
LGNTKSLNLIFPKEVRDLQSNIDLAAWLLGYRLVKPTKRHHQERITTARYIVKKGFKPFQDWELPMPSNPIEPLQFKKGFSSLRSHVKEKNEKGPFEKRDEIRFRKSSPNIMSFPIYLPQIDFPKQFIQNPVDVRNSRVWKSTQVTNYNIPGLNTPQGERIIVKRKRRTVKIESSKKTRTKSMLSSNKISKLILDNNLNNSFSEDSDSVEDSYPYHNTGVNLGLDNTTGRNLGLDYTVAIRSSTIPKGEGEVYASGNCYFQNIKRVTESKALKTYINSSSLPNESIFFNH